MKYTLIFLLIAISLIACKNESIKTDYSHIKNAFVVEIKIPAGKTSEHSFLPYPGNFGKVSGKKNSEILVLSEGVKVGTKMSVRAIGTLVLKEQNRIRNIIIATPLDTVKQLSKIADFQEFIVKNAGEKQIIQDWFLYQKGLGETELVGWEDEKYSWDLIKQKK